MGSYWPFCTRTAVEWQLQRLYSGQFRVVAAVAAGAWIAVVAVAAVVDSRQRLQLQRRLLHRTTTRTRPLATPTPHHDGARTWLDWGRQHWEQHPHPYPYPYPHPGNPTDPDDDAPPRPPPTLLTQDKIPPPPRTHTRSPGAAPRCQIRSLFLRRASQWVAFDQAGQQRHPTNHNNNNKLAPIQGKEKKLPPCYWKIWQHGRTPAAFVVRGGCRKAAGQ